MAIRLSFVPTGESRQQLTLACDRFRESLTLFSTAWSPFISGTVVSYGSSKVNYLMPGSLRPTMSHLDFGAETIGEKTQYHEGR